MLPAVAFAVLVLSFAGLYARPAKVRDWQVPLAGAVVVAALGAFPARELAETAWESARIVGFFAGLMLLSGAADHAGLYEDLERWLRRVPAGRPATVAVVVIGLGITALLSNDMTPLVLTPAAVRIASGGGASPEAFAVTFVADGASLILPISNPVNLLYYERFGMGLGDYLREVTAPAIAGAVALGTAAVLTRSWWRRDEEPRRGPSRGAAPGAQAARSRQS